MFSAKVIKHSVAPCGEELITAEICYPRFIHAEIMTHRDRARNSASSRAIPWEKILVTGELHPKCMKSMILNNPVIPIHFGKEQTGMQSADEELNLQEQEEAKKIILEMRDFCVAGVDRLAKLGLHKSLCNRYTEPWMWITVVMSSTKWDNFFHLRCHSAAERHFQHIAKMLREEIRKSKPEVLKKGEWHLPYIFDEDKAIEPDIKVLTKISAGRCARVSYLTHDGRRDHKDDIKLFDRLVTREVNSDDPIHSSPLEHVAEAWDTPIHSGPFVGFKQFRKEFPNECFGDKMVSTLGSLV